MTDTVLVDKATLQKLLDYITENEWDSYQNLLDIGVSESLLEAHIYSLAGELQNCVDDQA